jgi:hypothetical protein
VQPMLLSAIAAAGIAAIAGYADRRRSGRRDVDAVGFMPWTGLSLAATFAAVILAALHFTGHDFGF